jgi:uncharacterized protein YcfJ
MPRIQSLPSPTLSLRASSRRAWPALLLAAACAAGQAQGPAIQPENVRMDHAQVMRVQPIYQTLRATRMEQQCDPPGVSPAPAADGEGLSRIVGAVKGALSRKPAPAAGTAEAGANCRMVPVVREFRRPVAFDVDYVYRGMKYRSRLPYDPGTRLRVRVSVTPYPSPPAAR